MPGAYFIEYRGKRMLYEDYSICTPDDIEKYLGEAAALIRREPQASVLALVNVTGARFNVDTAERMKDFVSRNTPYIKCSAIFGLGGLQSVLYRTVTAFTGRKNLIVSDSEQAAKDYLADLP